MAASQGRKIATMLRTCAMWFWCLVKVFVLMTFSAMIGTMSPWNWTYEYDVTCQNPPGPANHSGVKVLLYAPAKTGTKSMMKALIKLGLKNAYHSEEFLWNIWSGISIDYFRRPENRHLVHNPETELLTQNSWDAEQRVWRGTPFAMNDNDLRVLRDTKPEELAAAISRCRVDTIAFDGMEELFWDVYKVSPGAKIIALNWRKYPQWRKSWLDFNRAMIWACMSWGQVVGSMYFLPWPVVMIPILELLSGNSIYNAFSTGSPPFTEGSETLARMYYRYAALNSKWTPHQNGGLRRLFVNESDYLDYFEEARQRIPAENWFEWDMKKNNLKDLCGFLGMSGLPECEETGRLPSGVNVLYIERDNPWVTFGFFLISVFFHWLNYRIVGKALTLLWRAACRLLKARRPKVE